MYLLKKLTITNFRGFRDKAVFYLENSSYLVGPNNSGKTSVLNAIRFFFDDTFRVDENFINKTAFLSKGKKTNQAEVTIEFDLESLTVKSLKNSLIKEYKNNLLSVSRIVVVATETKIVSEFYRVNSQETKQLPEDVLRLIRSVHLTYLHPQEGRELFQNAQEKLRQRLLANWGRNSNITTSLKDLQNSWNDLREKTNKYLSGALTENLQSMWPGSSASINLLKNIKDIIGISDISFLGYEGAPEIDLTLQGTGAQSTILFLTHFLLDSDRSLHRGEYHPLWLIEEPESFLHADLLANLAKQLNSEKWLDNIQMVVSTHSPMLLAGTSLAKEKINWTVLDRYVKKYNKLPDNYSEKEIEELGSLMGDPNFYAYFTVFQNKKLIFIEDERKDIKDAFISAGIQISDGPSGISWVKKYLDVLKATPEILQSEAYFIVDADKGKREINSHIEAMTQVEEKLGFRKFQYDKSKIFLILLPDNRAVEFLFDEYETHIEECIDKIWNKDFSIKKNIPSNLSQVGTKARQQSTLIKTNTDAINLIKNAQDVKNLFWIKVSSNGYKMSSNNQNVLKKLLSI